MFKQGILELCFKLKKKNNFCSILYTIQGFTTNSGDSSSPCKELRRNWTQGRECDHVFPMSPILFIIIVIICHPLQVLFCTSESTVIPLIRLQSSSDWAPHFSHLGVMILHFCFHLPQLLRGSFRHGCQERASSITIYLVQS